MKYCLFSPQKSIFLDKKAVAPIHRAAAFPIRQKLSSFAVDAPSKIFLKNRQFYWQNGPLHSRG